MVCFLGKSEWYICGDGLFVFVRDDCRLRCLRCGGFWFDCGCCCFGCFGLSLLMVCCVRYDVLWGVVVGDGFVVFVRERTFRMRSGDESLRVRIDCKFWFIIVLFKMWLGLWLIWFGDDVDVDVCGVEVLEMEVDFKFDAFIVDWCYIFFSLILFLLFLFMVCCNWVLVYFVNLFMLLICFLIKFRKDVNLSSFFRFVWVFDFVIVTSRRNLLKVLLLLGLVLVFEGDFLFFFIMSMMMV